MNINEFKPTRVFLLVSLLLLISIKVLGQCTNPPTVSLSSTSGSTCGTTPITVSRNAFGGSATKITIKEDGDGSVVPAKTSTSPFSFTYTPKNKDIGKTVIITVTTNDPLGACVAATATYTLTVNANPAAPVVETTTQPTCTVSTGSVVLNGLPASGTWTLTRSPGAVTTTGTGTSTTITLLASGTYTYTVTNAEGCISRATDGIIINAQITKPPAPTGGFITPPTCTNSTGSVVLNGLPSTGIWMLTRYPGTITSMGSGTSTTVTGLATGTYNYTVTNAAGCISAPSANVVIPAQPIIPSAPVVGTITQPNYSVPTGSVVLSGLPSSGTWIVTSSPDEVTTTGTGTSKTMTALPAGVFTFTVTNSAGCTSTESNEVIISTLGIPILTITNPETVCSPSTVDLAADEVTEGSTPGLTYTYWTDDGATEAYSTPAEATAGTYYIKGTTVSGYYDIKPVIVTVDQMPIANAGPDQILEYVFGTTMDAEPLEYGTGVWSLMSGSGEIADTNDIRTSVNKLSIGKNELLWTVKYGVCPAATNKVIIFVNDLVIPTLITPNMDGRNDYFILKGIETLGKTELVIIDRRGVQVYKNTNYDNSWDGVDYNNNPLLNDTYYFVLRTEKNNSISGYIVIRK